jgi:Protein of unknown function (DUF1997)
MSGNQRPNFVLGYEQLPPREGSKIFMRATLTEQSMIEVDRSVAQSETASTELPTIRFANRFADVMAMNAAVPVVSAYLDRHSDWFVRCAHPMQVEPIRTNGYAITIGKFNSSGYVIEPQVGLELLPQDEGVYRIQTIELPSDPVLPYTVDFQAEMRLAEAAATTKVEWHLDLAVEIQFPKFIYKLPRSVIQKTGDQVLKQIVRQVSKSLTKKVQKDFHSNAGLSLPR